MRNNQQDIVRDGDWVKKLQSNEDGFSTGGTNIFRIKGAASLQGRDAAQALTTAIIGSDDDTYTEVPFTVDDTGYLAPQAQPVTITPSQPKTQPAPLQYAPVGMIVLILGILAWRRS